MEEWGRSEEGWSPHLTDRHVTCVRRVIVPGWLAWEGCFAVALLSSPSMQAGWGHFMKTMAA